VEFAGVVMGVEKEIRKKNWKWKADIKKQRRYEGERHKAEGESLVPN